MAEPLCALPAFLSLHSPPHRPEAATHKQVDGIAVITVVPGEGLAALFENDLNAARVIAGGQTMNPSTEDFLAAIDSLPNDDIVLLPNNRNIIMAAEQAASLSRSKHVRVIPSRTVPQGIAAMLAYRSVSGESLDAVASVMEESLREIVSIEMTTAIRDTTVDEVTVKQGQIIGLLNGKLVAAGDEVTSVLLAVMRKAHAEDRELVTIYYGDEVDETHAQALVDAISGPFGDLTFEVVRGGQPLYPYIISIE